MKKRRFMKTIISISLFAMLAACGNNGENSAASNTPGDTGSKTGAQEEVTLKFFSNIPDRSTGIGLVEQTLIDNYMKENPHIKIEVETAEENAYKDKIKIYNASNEMPDIIHAWGDNGFLSPLLNAGSLAELNPADFQDYDFLPGALEKFTRNGKLYGLAKNTDFWAVIYNKKIFADNGLQVPTTLTELQAVSEQLKAKGLVPIALAGKEQWEPAINFDLFLQRAAGTFDVSKKGLDRTGTFNDPSVVEAAKLYQQMSKGGVFGEGFINSDYGAAKNMFTQGKAAMYLIGEWELSMATDPNIPEVVRNNLGAFPFPGSDKAKTTDLASWFGGGYALAKNSPHLKESTAFLKWLFKPENWAKTVWQSGAAFPAQKYDQFYTGKETDLQKDFTNILIQAKTAGDLIQNVLTGQYQKQYYDALQKLLAGVSTPEQFQQSLEDAAAKNASQ